MEAFLLYEDLFLRLTYLTLNDIEIRYRSSGISFAFSLAVSRRWYVPNYKISLESTSSEWKTTTFKLTDLRKHYIGKALNDRLKKETLKDIIRIGFITDQKKIWRV